MSLAFTKAGYDPDEPIEFQVVVEGPTETTRTVTFTGTVTMPEAAPTPVSGSTTVVDRVEYGAFAADGYSVTQDPADPSRYTATAEVTP